MSLMCIDEFLPDQTVRHIVGVPARQQSPFPPCGYESPAKAGGVTARSAKAESVIASTAINVVMGFHSCNTAPLIHLRVDSTREAATSTRCTSILYPVCSCDPKPSLWAVLAEPTRTLSYGQFGNVSDRCCASDACRRRCST